MIKTMKTKEINQSKQFKTNLFNTSQDKTTQDKTIPNQPSLTKIKIDDRESDYIFNGFKKENIEYEKIRLECGDILYGNTVIEHKTIEDFVQSFTSKHLQIQLQTQEENYEHSILIITGDFKRLFFNPYLRHITSEQITGMIASIMSRYKKTQILQTYNIASGVNKSENRIFAILCRKILEKSNDEKEIKSVSFIKKINKKEDIERALLRVLGLNKQQIDIYLTKYIFRNIFSINTSELLSLKGFGKQTVEKLKENILKL